ncbi:unnamed protein product, partial [Larinioides sclopetarius]
DRSNSVRAGARIWGIRPPEILTILRRSADLSSQISAWEDSLSCRRLLVQGEPRLAFEG